MARHEPHDGGELRARDGHKPISARSRLGAGEFTPDKVMNDNSITPEQCRGARRLLGITQDDLCERANLRSRKALADFETGKATPLKRTLADIRWALEAAGVDFTNADNTGPGVQLK